MKKFLFRIGLLLAAVIAILILFLKFAPDSTRLDGFGISGAHYSFLENASLDGQLDLVKEIGFGWYRVTLPWEWVENLPAQYDWSYSTGGGNWDFSQLLQGLEARHIDPLVVLDGGPIFLQHTYPSQPVDKASLLSAWERYVSALVAQFGDQVDAWEIGSQPNTSAYWGRLLFPSVDLASATSDMELYADMLEIAHRIIHTADPNDVVILGGLYFSPDNSCDTDPFGFLGALQKLGAWDDFDVIGLQLSWGAAGPQDEVDFQVNHDPYSGVCIPNATVAYDLSSAVQAIYDFAGHIETKPIWVTSIGWTSSQIENMAVSHGIATSRQESDLVVRSVIPLLSQPGVEKVFYYGLAAEPDQPNYALGPFGLQTFSNLTTQLTGSQELGLLDETFSTAGTQEYRFQKDGVLYSIIFGESNDQSPDAVVLSGTQGMHASGFFLDAVGLTNTTAQAMNTDATGNVIAIVGSRPLLVISSPGDPLDSISLGVQDRATVLKESVQSGINNLLGSAKSAILSAISNWFEGLKQKAITSVADQLQ